MKEGEDTIQRTDEEIMTLQQRTGELERLERGRMEQFKALEQNERSFNELLNATTDVIFLMDLEGVIILANENTAGLLSAPVDRLKGRSIYSFISRRLTSVLRNETEVVAATGKPVHFEFDVRNKVLDTSINPVTDDGGKVSRLSVYVHDITYRKGVEAALQRAEETYRNIFENAREGIFQTSPEGRFLSANPSLARIHGYESPEELVGSITDLGTQLYVHPEDRERFVRILRDKGSVEDFEVEMKRKDGSFRWIMMNARAVRDGNGTITYYQGTMQDISERKKAEAALLESEERYRIAIEHSPAGIAIIKGDVHLYVNRRFVEMFGFDGPEEIIGKPLSPTVYADDREFVMGISRERQRGGVVPERYEFRGVRKDGRIIYVEVSAANISYRGEPAYLIYLRDITGRKQAEEALRVERNRFHTMSENAPFGITLIDRDGTYTYLNPKFKEIFGYDLADVPNGRVWFRKAYPDPAYRRQVILNWIEHVKNTSPGERMPGTAVATCKDGKKKTISYIPVLLSTGEYIVSYEDITERIRAQETLIQSHKELEALNRVKTKAVHHISHELKTPLAVIQGNLRLLRRRLNDCAPAGGTERFMEILERNLERLLEVSAETDDIFRVSQELEAGGVLEDLERLSQRVEDFADMPPDVRLHWYTLKTWLSQYTQKSPTSSWPVDLYPAVLHGVGRVKRLASHRTIHFETEGENNLFVQLDPTVLASVIEGLLKNAVENTPDGGVIRVVAERKNEEILLHVTDYGVGITAGNMQYLFDGLFHTKETDLYTSKSPFEFDAGGKGLDLLRMKIYGKRFGFDVSAESKRCVYIPTDQDSCPGDIALCPHVKSPEECAESGGTTFTVAFSTRPSAENVPERPEAS
jgi:PAS domain S-box-containing protein